MPPVVRHQAVPQRAFGESLQPRIQRCAHRQTAFVQPFLAKLFDQFAPHFLQEIASLDDQCCGPRHHLEFFGHRLPGRFVIDIILFQHAADDPIAPCHRRVVLADGMVVIRRFRQGGQIGSLGDGQFIQRFIEIIQGGGGDAIGRIPEVDFIEVELKNTLFRKCPLNPERENCLFDLAFETQFVGKEKVFRDLLGNRRCTDGPARSLQDYIETIRDQGAAECRGVDARVVVKILVFRRDERIDEMARQCADRHEHPPFNRILGNKAAIAGMHPGYGGRIVLRQLGVIG